jgi:hypothetical protein
MWCWCTQSNLESSVSATDVSHLLAVLAQLRTEVEALFGQQQRQQEQLRHQRRQLERMELVGSAGSGGLKNGIFADR